MMGFFVIMWPIINVDVACDFCALYTFVYLKHSVLTFHFNCDIRRVHIVMFLLISLFPVVIVLCLMLCNIDSTRCYLLNRGFPPPPLNMSGYLGEYSTYIWSYRSKRNGKITHIRLVWLFLFHSMMLRDPFDVYVVAFRYLTIYIFDLLKVSAGNTHIKRKLCFCFFLGFCIYSQVIQVSQPRVKRVRMWNIVTS